MCDGQGSGCIEKLFSAVFFYKNFLANSSNTFSNFVYDCFEYHTHIKQERNNKSFKYKLPVHTINPVMLEISNSERVPGCAGSTRAFFWRNKTSIIIRKYVYVHARNDDNDRRSECNWDWRPSFRERKPERISGPGSRSFRHGSRTPLAQQDFGGMCWMNLVCICFKTSVLRQEKISWTGQMYSFGNASAVLQDLWNLGLSAFTMSNLSLLLPTTKSKGKGFNYDRNIFLAAVSVW